MRKIEKETLQIIENYKKDKITEIETLIKIRKENIKQKIQKDFEETFNIKELEKQKLIFQEKYEGNICIKVDIHIYEYNTYYEQIYKKDKFVCDYQKDIDAINEEKRKIKLALQCFETSSTEYKEALEKLYNN